MVILALRRGLRVIEVPVNYRGRIGESKITGTLKGTLRTGVGDDRAHPQLPGRAMTWRAAALVVALAAAVPYLPTLDNYFVQDDFGVVALLSSKPATYFPRWFVTTWMEDIWGYTPDEIRPFPAVSYQIAAVFGAASPDANHVVNIAVPRRQRAAACSPSRRRAAGLAAWRRPRSPRCCSRSCRCRPSRWRGSPDASTRCRRASSWRRSCTSCAGAPTARAPRLRLVGGVVRGGAAVEAEHRDPRAVPGGLRPARRAVSRCDRRGRGCGPTCRLPC